MGYSERLLGGADGIGWKDSGRENIQASVKWSSNPDPVGVLCELNELLFRNAWHMPAWRGHSMGSLPPPSLHPFSAPVTLGGIAPCPIGDSRT